MPENDILATIIVPSDTKMPSVAVPDPTTDELTRSVIADKPKRSSARDKLQILKVSVRAIDLRFVDTPILCGHYLGDTIAGAEKEIDRMVNGALSQRERLGVYAYQRGTSAVVLNVRNVADVLRGSCKGAVVVGLGEFGKLSTTDITETVRAGVLRLLLHSHDLTNTIRTNKAQRGLTLSSLLIGQNSNMHISVQDSIDAIVLGVCEANRQYAEATQRLLRVTQLEFIEVYLDTAITAAREVLDVSGRLEKDLRRLDARVEPARQLIRDIGVRQRLQINAAPGYWPRLIVTDASSQEATQSPKADASTSLKPKLTEKLKYVYLSERARAEAVVLQRQPGLIEALLKEAIRQDSINHDISHTLFQLMVPLEFKAAARQTESLVLVVDEYTANLPWEMLVTDGLPLVLKTKIVRQLITLNYRPVVRSALRPTACVIGNPSTLGYFEHFEGHGQSDTGNALQNLPGAAKEAACVRETLERSGYIVEFCPPEREALDVFNCIYKQPYRVLMIAGHGVFNALARDGTRRSGVVLSGGILFTAAEIGQMEVVPEVVFLNCCHLGQIDSSAHFNRLAASVSRELIEMGVRCVIAAGWQVNDDAASLFAETFFSALALEKQPFGSAVWLARKHTYERFPNLNTWGAYQAYGDPEYVLDPTLEPNKRDHDWIPVAPEELLDTLASLLLDETLTLTKASTKIERLLNKSPQEWRDRPDVQAAIGDIFAKFRTDGFPQASLALQNAIAGEDTLGRVAVRTIETLARLEMNVGIDKGGAEGLKWVEQALDRVQGLLDISSASGRNTSGASGRNTQSSESSGSVKSHNDARWTLLADAWMSKAALLNQQRQSWSKKVVPALGKSACAYQRAAEKVEQLMCNPSPILNQLIVETLIGAFTPEQIKEGKVRAEFCKKKAQERFSENNNFADAVLTVEAELLMCLLGGTLNADIERLSAQFRECVEMASPSDAEIKYFTIRWQRFCEFLERREGAKSLDVIGLKNLGRVLGRN